MFLVEPQAHVAGANARAAEHYGGAFLPRLAWTAHGVVWVPTLSDRIDFR